MAEPVSAFDPAPRALAAVRLRAEQLMRERDDRGLLELVPELRADSEWWAHLWAPGAALAAARVGAAGARELLEEAVAGGFRQPELFDGELERVFGWAELSLPAPELELVDWPEAAAVLPLELYSIAPERLPGLLERLPSPGDSAWGTALGLLEWVHGLWRHANDHVDAEDALTVLERVEAGERFACVEYSIVLSQALNAVRIPSRRVDLRQDAHHTGVGRGHVVSEAWIDDLDRWVVLDGQNGSYWTDAAGTPLGVRELQALFEPPHLIGAGSVEPPSAGQAAAWFSYFASASTTGITWAGPTFAPVFQGSRVIKTPRLVRDSGPAYPRLSALSTGLTGTPQRPVVRFQHHHPYGVGVRLHLDSGPIDTDEWPLDLTPGDHELTVTIRTPYGETAHQRFAYLVRSGSTA
ncbi:hypothetical protein [Kribbella sp. NPDC051770]|uniref:hypothetical protein n=1 Tax=Kribbella sp. NPDC051770 TaxID=3155413 RepID=UPI003442EC8F